MIIVPTYLPTELINVIFEFADLSKKMVYDEKRKEHVFRINHHHHKIKPIYDFYNQCKIHVNFFPKRSFPCYRETQICFPSKILDPDGNNTVKSMITILDHCVSEKKSNIDTFVWNRFFVYKRPGTCLHII